MTASDKGPVKVELLPCPFCGGSNIAYVAGDGCEYLTCDDCVAEGPSAPDQPSAIALWDTRASTDQQALVAELVDASERVLRYSEPNSQEDREARSGLRAIIAKVRGGEGR